MSGIIPRYCRLYLRTSNFHLHTDVHKMGVCEPGCIVVQTAPHMMQCSGAVGPAQSGVVDDKGVWLPRATADVGHI